MFYVGVKKSRTQKEKHSVHSEICLYCRFKNSRLQVDLSASLPSLAAMCHCCIFTRLIRRASAASVVVVMIFKVSRQLGDKIASCLLIVAYSQD